MARELPLEPYPVPRHHATLRALGRRIHFGRLALHLPDGSACLFVGEAPGPNAVLSVKDSRFLRRLLFGGGTGFGEAYVDGICDSPDVSQVVALASRNYRLWEEALEGRPFYKAARRLVHALRPNSRTGARRNIARHYDLGNAFYAAWLDPSMTYSSAFFEAPSESLESAQRNKYRKVAEMAELRPGQHLLEVGCGWGGFAAFAAQEIGCKVTAITLSKEQHAYASQRIQQAGLSDRVEVRRQDYRDTEGRFDRIASIEMFEAVGEAYWPQFFDKLRDSLKPGGRAALQVITITDSLWERYRREVDFIQRYIFPGGMLPSPSALQSAASRAGFHWQGESSFGDHYAETLARWRERFLAAWPALANQDFDERFRRIWTYYLSYCEGGFREGRIDVRHVALARE